MSESKPKRLIFPGEAERQQKAFKEIPVLIIHKFLQSFNSEGEQVFDVPDHVLAALAGVFRAFWNKEPDSNSLDAAFGGSPARRRNELQKREDDGEAAFDLIVEKQRISKGDAADRAGTPFEVASEAVASNQRQIDAALRILCEALTLKRRPHNKPQGHDEEDLLNRCDPTSEAILEACKAVTFGRDDMANAIQVAIEELLRNADPTAEAAHNAWEAIAKGKRRGPDAVKAAYKRTGKRR